MKKILFLAFPLYADFQIAHTLFFIRKVGNAKIVTATIDGNSVESVGGLITQAQEIIAEANPNDYDLILLPGGDGIEQVVNESSVHDLLKKANKVSVPIASICGSSTFLGKAGLLEGRKFTCNLITYELYKDVFAGAEYTGNDIEIGDYLITAKGIAFAKFTIAVGEQLKIWKNQEQVEKVFQFCKGNE